MFRNSAIVYFAFATGLHAQTIYVNTHIEAHTAPSEIGFLVSKYGQSPPFNDISCVDCATGIGFQYDGSKLKTIVVSLDEASDWFLVQPGDTFSLATINAGQFPAITNLFPPPHGGEVTVGSGEFYLGVRTGGYAISNRTAYGWVHLRPVNGMLTMVQNVMSYNSRGIIVGTTIVVPEPCAGISIIGGLATLLTLRRQR